MELTVNPIFKNHVSPLPQDVYDNLESNIKANGCLVPIVVWDGTIIDGHNRFEICQKNGIPFEVREEHFNSEAEALLWITAQQLVRRNLTPVERVIQALKEKPTLIEMGKRKQGFRSDLHHLVSDGPHNTRHIIAKMAGVKPWLVGDIEYILAHGDESLQKQVLTGEIAPSTAKQIIVNEKWKAEQERLEREEAERKLAKANGNSKKGADDQWGVIIPFPKQPTQPSWWQDVNVPGLGPIAAGKLGGRFQGRIMNGQYGANSQYVDADDDDEQYDVDDQYDDDDMDEADGTDGADDVDHQDSDNRNFVTFSSDIHDFEYIKSRYREQCDLLLEVSDDMLNDHILDRDLTEENVGAIKEIVTECFTAILTGLDNAYGKANQTCVN